MYNKVKAKIALNCHLCVVSSFTHIWPQNMLRSLNTVVSAKIFEHSKHVRRVSMQGHKEVF